MIITRTGLNGKKFSGLGDRTRGEGNESVCKTGGIFNFQSLH